MDLGTKRDTVRERGERKERGKEKAKARERKARRKARERATAGKEREIGGTMEVDGTVPWLLWSLLEMGSQEGPVPSMAGASSNGTRCNGVTSFTDCCF